MEEKPQSSTATPTDEEHAVGVPAQVAESPAAVPSASSDTPGYTRLQKGMILAIVMMAGSVSTISANIYYPILPKLATYFHVTPTLINITVTTYMIFQGLSPTVWGAFSDSLGRRVIYIITITIYVGACIGLAESRKYYELLILRAIQSTGSASTYVIGAGVVGDITTREERGGYMGIYQGGILLPLAVGPILGGGLAGGLGWRSVFWALVILGGTVLAALGLYLPETLKRFRDSSKWWTIRPIDTCARKRKSNQDTEAVVAAASQPKVKLDFLAPFKVVFGGEVTAILLFLALYYTVWQMTVTAMSTLFATSYGLTTTQIGLTYIGNGAGCIIGTVTTGRIMDADYTRTKRSYNGPDEDFPLEKARLRTIWIWSAMQIASTLVFGWTLDKKVHLSVPIIATFFAGWASTSTQGVISTFLVDAFPGRSASATAALNMARCLVGAGGTAAIIPVIEAIGTGWAFTLWSLVMCAALVLVFVQMKWGGRWRRRREEKERKQ